jgi:hypothetical protein
MMTFLKVVVLLTLVGVISLMSDFGMFSNMMYWLLK